MIQKLYNVFIENDALMVEINPMTEDSNGNGKISYCTSLMITMQILVKFERIIVVIVTFLSINAIFIYCY